MAAAGTPDPGTDNGTTDCNVSSGAPVPTGARSSCVSNWGASDMVGNLFEWVADWVPYSSSCGLWDINGEVNDDLQCFAGAETTTLLPPGALLRGGLFFMGPQAGVLAVSGNDEPSSSREGTGFRCAR